MAKFQKNERKIDFSRKKWENLGRGDNFSAFLEKMHFFTTNVNISTHLKHFQAFLRIIKEYVKISKKRPKNRFFAKKWGNFGGRENFSAFFEKMYFFTAYVKISAHFKHFCGK
jgi:hypothetical protein